MWRSFCPLATWRSSSFCQEEQKLALQNTLLTFQLTGSSYDLSVQISTCLRVSFSWRSSWFFSQISLIFSSSSSCLQDKTKLVGLHGSSTSSCLGQIFLFGTFFQHQGGFFVFSDRRSALTTKSGKSLVLLPCFTHNSANTKRECDPFRVTI